MHRRLSARQMDGHLSSPHLTARQVTRPIIPIGPNSSLFLGLQQQWKGAQDSLYGCFSQCIKSIQQKIQERGLGPVNCEGVRGLQLSFFKLGSNSASGNPRRGEVWATQLKKAWETVGMQVGQTLQEGKNKLAVSLIVSQGNTMWACSSLARNLCHKHFEHGHLFDLAMSTEEVAKRLEGIPVYTVSNSANEFVLISDMNNERSLGLFCFRQQDAEALLSQVRDKEPGLGRGAKVVAVSLNKVYELHIEGIAFRFLPDPHQVMNALEAKAKAKANTEDPRPSFAGVPVFQSDNLILRSKNKRFRPIFFSKEDLDRSLERAFEQQRKLNPSLQISTALQIGSFEDVIKRMESSEESSPWTDIVFIPPGIDIFNRVGKPDPAQAASNDSAFG